MIDKAKQNDSIEKSDESVGGHVPEAKTESVSGNDTICALATAVGVGAISILRLSGENSLRICDRIFLCNGKKPSERASHTMVHGQISDSQGAKVDEALLLIMRSPKSYTGEEVAEIQCHGGRAVARRVLQVCLAAGCRSAAPGEFTRRAFLNGRLDLVQAEAVQDLIRAETDRAAAAALDQLEGGLSRRIQEISNPILHALSLLEASLDFPDDELPPISIDTIRASLKKAQGALSETLAGWQEGHILREGIRVVIQGPPNVGKSSLFNQLVGHERVIVSEYPGTTRDTIEESLYLNGYLVRLTDTAGLREAECAIEKEGVLRSLQHGKKADLVLFTVDGSLPAPPGLQKELKKLDPDRSLILCNKADLPHRIELGSDTSISSIFVSARTGEGMDTLRKCILDKVLRYMPSGFETGAVISERHRKILQQVSDPVEESMNLLTTDDQTQWVLAASKLRIALQDLGEVTGENYREDLLDQIFSSFCIGK